MTEWKDIKDAPRDGTRILAKYKSISGFPKFEQLHFCNKYWRDEKFSIEWIDVDLEGWIHIPKEKKHRCNNLEDEGVSVTNQATCYETEKGKLRIRNCCTDFAVDYCPFCGFTLKK